MPIYQYICEFGHIHEEFQSIKEFDKNRLVECKECGNDMVSYFDTPPLGFVHQEPTTIGQLGEANFKALGKVKGEEMIAKQKEKKEEARKHSGLMDAETYKNVRKIANLNKKQQEKYIHTGKLPP